MPSFEESFKFTKYYACKVSDRWGGREAVVVDTYLFEIGRQGLSVNGVAVILRSDMYSSSGQIQTWNVMGAITELSCQLMNEWMNEIDFFTYLEFRSTSACSESYQLVAQTNAKDGQLCGLEERANWQIYQQLNVVFS